MLPEKILVLGKGSESDPSMDFAKTFFEGSDVKVIGPYVSSCHGCYEKMDKLYSQLQMLADKNVRVVSIEEGGLYFAKPSIAASKTTFPIIARPLDIVSFQADMVPSGNAVIGTVGVERKVDNEYELRGFEKTLNIAKDILNLDDDKVFVNASEGIKPDILKELSKFNIQDSKSSGLVLTYDQFPSDAGKGTVNIWADTGESLQSSDYIGIVERQIAETQNTLKVRGKANLVNYAAKILSLQRSDIRDKLKAMAEKKRAGYVDADIIKDLGL